MAEVALPWAGLGVEAAAGKFIGFDVHVLDDDDGGNRDRKRAWHATIDQSHANAALFGTVSLRGE